VQIELLWIIPIVAFSFFIFLIAFLAQKKEDNPYKELSKEVIQFNSGFSSADSARSVPVDRLGEIEKTITTVTDSIAKQQKEMELVHKKTSFSSSEIDQLKDKLRDLYKEYDIVVSENYTLKAKVKKLSIDGHEGHSENTMSSPSQTRTSSGNKVNLKLYEDTRTYNLEHTSEIDMADLGT
jgi:archaellum component FlaC